MDVLSLSAGAPSAPALLAPGERWSYEELDASVERRAAELRAEGREEGSVAPLTVESDARSVLELLALWRLGAVPAPLSPVLTGAEREVAAAAVASSPPGSGVVVWTSGTAGRPRGVALGLRSFVASAEAAAERLELGARDVWLASLSPAHVGGLALLTRSLLLGSTLVVAGPFDAATASDLVDGSGTLPPVTHMSLVPTQLLRVLESRRGRRAPATFRCALIGGAHAPAALVGRAHRAGWPLALTYGATEMCSQVATAPPWLSRRKPGTVGSALPGVEVAIGDDDEILTRGVTQAIGYVGGSEGPVADADGWYHTGDLGRIDGDGDLWVTGRREDRIVSGGVTIDAVEVEEALRAHPAVIDACVAGVPDEEWGEVVGAWIEPVEGEFDEEEVSDHLRSLLSAPKLPRVWRRGGPLPRNRNGKVDRGLVRSRLADG